MDSANSILLNRFFTRNTFRHIIDGDDSKTYVATIRRYIKNYDRKTNMECISEVYEILKRGYQNEYYYKNTLLNKLLLGVHSPRTTTALTEVPVGNSKADFILINGSAVAYEIKTSLDNFERLDGQIEDYYKAFSRVVVVTSEGNYGDVKKRLEDSPVGICLLTKKGTLSMRKEPEEFCDMLSKSTMFKVLRKNEYERILYNYYGTLPDVSQFEYYRACQDLFESIPIDDAYNNFIKSLKLRMKLDIVEYAEVPYELKFIVYFSNYKESDYAKLSRFLHA